MALPPGTRLGPYEVIAPLGAGGMGEVYRARDARLGRDVAIKVLPTSFAAHADRLARFEQEARATGALNHPNILAIHDFGSHEGMPYLVSELLEGETLRARLAEGPLPVRKATELLAQAARGLAAAHDRGIVHRDLKPENLFITRDGRMKILDFGLAKLVQSEPQPGAITSLPTTPAGTEAGVIMGTVGYMAPEQVRGHPADARADLFALGAILFEALTARRAFDGESAVETMHAILKTDPPELTAVDPALPPALDRIVRHCLEKNPEERYQTARDVAFTLESLSGAAVAAGGSRTGTLAVAEARVAGTGDRRLKAAAALAIGSGLALALSAALFWKGSRAAAAGPPTFERLTFRHGFVHSARFVHQGPGVVYGAAWDGQPIEIFLSQPGSPEARPLGLSGANVLAVSPSDELAISRIARVQSPNLYRAIGTLARVPLNGGAPRDLADSVTYADWSPDGKGLAIIRDRGDHRCLEYPVGTTLYETPLELFNPRISPDGRRVALWQTATGINAVIVVEADRRVRILSPGWRDWWFLSWSPDGREVWFGATQVGFLTTVYAIDLEGHRRTLYAGPGNFDVHDVAPDGRALLGAVKQRMRTMGRLHGWPIPRDLSWFDGIQVVDLSADGSTFLLLEDGEAGGPGQSVYAQKADGAPPVRLGEGHALALSPDGQWALAARDRRELVLLPAGSGVEHHLAPGAFEAVADARWFPDGRRFALLASRPGARLSLFVVDAGNGALVPLADEGYQDGSSLAVSPDGRRVAAVMADGRPALVPADGGPPEFDSGLREGDLPVAFGASGASLYVVRRDTINGVVERVDLGTGRRAVWKELPVLDSAGVSNIARVVMTPDAQAWAWSWQQILTDLYLVRGLK